MRRSCKKQLNIIIQHGAGKKHIHSVKIVSLLFLHFSARFVNMCIFIVCYSVCTVPLVRRVLSVGHFLCVLG